MNKTIQQGFNAKRLLAVLIGTLVTHSVTADVLPGFHLQLLEDLGYNESVARNINNQGISVGTSIGLASFETDPRPVFWDVDGRVTSLENSVYPASGNEKIAAINELGNMVGTREDLGEVVWIDLVAAGLPDAYQAKDINESNQVAGTLVQYGSNTRSYFATVWNNLSPTLLGGEPTGFNSYANAINDQGEVVGTFSNGVYQVPVLWTAQQRYYLGTLPGFEPSAVALQMNNNGQAVGFSGATHAGRAVIWEAGYIAELGTFGGDYSTAIDINDAGQIIGLSSDANGVAKPFLWQDGVMYDLTPALCADVNTCNIQPGAINDQAQMVYTQAVPVSVGSYTLTDHLAYRVDMSTAALSSLPSRAAPLNFVAADGAGIVDGGAPAIGDADLSISLSASASSINSGGYVSFVIQVTNRGVDTARAVVATDPLPSNVVLVPERSDVQICDFPSTILSCRFGDLQPGQAVQATITVQHRSGSQINNTVTVDSATFDPQLGNNSASASVSVSSAKKRRYGFYR